MIWSPYGGAVSTFHMRHIPSAAVDPGIQDRCHTTSAFDGVDDITRKLLIES